MMLWELNQKTLRKDFLDVKFEARGKNTCKILIQEIFEGLKNE